MRRRPAEWRGMDGWIYIYYSPLRIPDDGLSCEVAWKGAWHWHRLTARGTNRCLVEGLPPGTAGAAGGLNSNWQWVGGLSGELDKRRKIPPGSSGDDRGNPRVWAEGRHCYGRARRVAPRCGGLWSIMRCCPTVGPVSRDQQSRLEAGETGRIRGWSTIGHRVKAVDCGGKQYQGIYPIRPVLGGPRTCQALVELDQPPPEGTKDAMGNRIMILGAWRWQSVSHESPWREHLNQRVRPPTLQ
ncbi:hypothetical protein NDU88_002604 [Pleurodeles waltl]|uniref:Uncharacterized protein n=1 Tax=Pleurodeles waltl TaxID=8319 RepID=A0AAV7WP21_PLEWA|nr:hypothetical protein NDU88_002604 [Pleurodeles waltl]